MTGSAMRLEETSHGKWKLRQSIAVKIQRRMLIMTVDKPRAKTPREPRREVRKQPAWITVDNGITKRECFVMDVSPGGAKIITDAAIDVRDMLGLELVPTHPKCQPCEVVWRRGNTYGIRFLP
jgi:hypothetical protein